MLSILLVEDHALVREGMAQILRQLDDRVELHEAADGDQAAKVLERVADLDLVMLDLALPGVDGLTWLTTQRKRFPALPMVVVSAYDDLPTVKRAMKAGAAGFVSKAAPADQLLDALRRVLDGEVVEPVGARAVALGPDVPSETTIGSRAQDFGLSPRQADVLGLMAKGRSNREIAQVLGLTEGTVKIHATAIYKALGVSSRTQALLAVSRKKVKL